MLFNSQHLSLVDGIKVLAKLIPLTTHTHTRAMVFYVNVQGLTASHFSMTLLCPRRSPFLNDQRTHTHTRTMRANIIHIYEACA